MPNDEYALVATDEDERTDTRLLSQSRQYWKKDAGYNLLSAFGVLVLAVVCFSIGFASGKSYNIPSSRHPQGAAPNKNGLLHPQSFLPESKRA
jgi:hypothetical protein